MWPLKLKMELILCDYIDFQKIEISDENFKESLLKFNKIRIEYDSISEERKKLNNEFGIYY